LVAALHGASWGGGSLKSQTTVVPRSLLGLPPLQLGRLSKAQGPPSSNRPRLVCKAKPAAAGLISEQAQQMGATLKTSHSRRQGPGASLLAFCSLGSFSERENRELTNMDTGIGNTNLEQSWKITENKLMIL